MGLPQTEKINVFLGKGLTSMTFGSTWLPNGAAIGLPRTVLFQNPEDVRNSFLESAGAPIDWDSELGTSLTAALTPSTQQINFVIAHEVAHLKNSDWMARVVLPPVTLVLAYHVARAVPQYVAPKHGLAGFVLVMAASLAVYLQLVASLSHRQEFRADKTAAQCSSGYAQGGLDHFAKRMKVDSALQLRKKASTLDRFKPSFDLHPPVQDRFDRLQTLMANS
ncbi:Transmembrane protein 177, partial [Geodia barretti]